MKLKVLLLLERLLCLVQNLQILFGYYTVSPSPTLSRLLPITCTLENASQVVNALLTQMDKLKSSPNVIILTTSNITAAIGKPII